MVDGAVGASRVRAVPDTAEAELRWPPPGLERIQGDLWRIGTSGALAGLLMVVPMLVAVSDGWHFATLGPFAGAWWVPVVVATVGLAFMLDAFVRLARLLRRASRAVERGYDLDTVVRVAADMRRDMGFLLRGRRHFSTMDGRERHGVGILRVLTPLLFSAAGIWLGLVLAIGLLVAARGWMGPDTLWMLTLLPAAGMYAFGVVTWTTEEQRVRRARRAWHGRTWTEDLDPLDIESWRADAGTPPSVSGAQPRLLRRLAVAALVAIAVVAVPVLTLLPASAIGPMLTVVSVPGSDAIQRRAAELEAYRPFRVETDPGVTAAEAGRLLQNLLYVGTSREPQAGELEPPLRIAAPWLPAEGGGPVGIPPHEWPAALFGLVEGSATPDLRAYLARVVEHRARPDFSRLARAERLDAASARWEDPLPPGTTPATVPVPRFTEFRAAAHAHVAAAAHALSEGRVDDAEVLVREIVSVGFLLADQGPTLMDNLIGQALIRDGGVALGSLWAVTDQADRGRELERSRVAAERAAARMPSMAPDDPEAIFARLPALVVDPGVVRGLRWENFAMMSTLAPCANLNRIVFGPDASYESFVAEARRSLVSWPSEEGLFELAAAGFLGDEHGSWLGRLFTLPMRSGGGGCIQSLEALRALY